MTPATARTRTPQPIDFMARDDETRIADANGAIPEPPPGFFDDDAPDLEPPEANVSSGRRFGASTDTDNEPPPPPDTSKLDALVTPAPSEWFNVEPPRRKWLLRDSRVEGAPGVLPLGKVGLLVGEGGVSKTMALVQLAIAVATGVRWLGALDIACEGPDGRVALGRALLVLGEEDAEEARRRLYRARLATGAPVPSADAIVVVPLAGETCAMLERDEAGNAREAAFLESFRGYAVARGPWALVVVDPLSRFAGPDAEIDNAAATRFVQACESIATATGATVLVAHHTHKGARGGATVDSSAARGSSAFTDGARFVSTLSAERVEGLDGDARTRLGEIVAFAVTKSNYGRKGDAILLRRDTDHGGALVPLDDDDRAMVEAAREKADPSAKRAAQRAADRDAREESNARKRSATASSKEADRRKRDEDDDAAARTIVSANPSDTVRRWVALLAKERACGTPRAHAALVRVRGGS